MSRPRIRCQAIEVTVIDPMIDHLEPSRAVPPPRDLLPWADPYIAALIDKVERRSSAQSDRRSRQDARFGRADLAGDDLAGSCSDGDDAELDDKFVPWSSSAAPQGNEFPRIYGGWPLLDDVPRDDA